MADVISVGTSTGSLPVHTKFRDPKLADMHMLVSTILATVRSFK